MRHEPEKTALLTVEIPGLTTTLLDQWAHQAGISLSILRARVTAEQARYVLKIEGAARRVTRFAQQSEVREVSRRLLNPASAGISA